VEEVVSGLRQHRVFGLLIHLLYNKSTQYIIEQDVP
jgi:hypothetical protein